MKFLNFYQFFVEAKIDDFLDVSNLSAEDKLRLRNINVELKNPSKYAKYMVDNWDALKQFDIDELLNTFESKLDRISDKEISHYTPAQLKELVDSLSSNISKTQQKSVFYVDPDLAEKIYEDDKVLIVSPKNFAGSQKYGANTRWCIVANEQHWNSYTDREFLKPYYILNKQLLKTDPFHKKTYSEEWIGNPDSKIAVMINDNNEIDSIWTSDDESVDGRYLISRVNVSHSLFKGFVADPSEWPLEKILSKIVIGTYDIKNGVINVNGSVNFTTLGGPITRRICIKNGKLNFKFGDVSEDFIVNYNRTTTILLMLTSLKGCPKYVGRNFTCAATGITALEGIPAKIGGAVNCDNSKQLTSLATSYKVSVGRDATFQKCGITSLAGINMEIGTRLLLKDNPKKFTKEEIDAAIGSKSVMLDLAKIPSYKKILEKYEDVTTEKMRKNGTLTFENSKYRIIVGVGYNRFLDKTLPASPWSEPQVRVIEKHVLKTPQDYSDAIDRMLEFADKYTARKAKRQ